VPSVVARRLQFVFSWLGRYDRSGNTYPYRHPGLPRWAELSGRPGRPAPMSPTRRAIASPLPTRHESRTARFSSTKYSIRCCRRDPSTLSKTPGRGKSVDVIRRERTGASRRHERLPSTRRSTRYQDVAPSRRGRRACSELWKLTLIRAPSVPGALGTEWTHSS
jgi:hypothetical protein